MQGRNPDQKPLNSVSCFRSLFSKDIYLEGRLSWDVYIGRETSLGGLTATPRIPGLVFRWWRSRKNGLRQASSCVPSSSVHSRRKLALCSPRRKLALCPRRQSCYSAAGRHSYRRRTCEPELHSRCVSAACGCQTLLPRESCPWPCVASTPIPASRYGLCPAQVQALTFLLVSHALDLQITRPCSASQQECVPHASLLSPIQARGRALRPRRIPRGTSGLRSCGWSRTPTREWHTSQKAKKSGRG